MIKDIVLFIFTMTLGTLCAFSPFLLFMMMANSIAKSKLKNDEHTNEEV